MKFQIHLKGKHHSGRGVRYVALDPDAHEAVLVGAAKVVSPEATILELKKIEWRNGVKCFVVEVTEPTEDPLTAKWRKVTPGDLEDLSQYFTAKDVVVLQALYRELHEVDPAEVEAIVGKALPVSED